MNHMFSKLIVFVGLGALLLVGIWVSFRPIEPKPAEPTIIDKTDDADNTHDNVVDSPKPVTNDVVVPSAESKLLADTTLAKGVAFLRSQIIDEREGSYWKDMRGKSPGYSALAVTALIRSGAKYGEDKQVTSVIDWLAGLQKQDGGLYVDDYPNYYTSVIIMALAEADKQKFALHLEKAAMFLKGLQFSTDKGNKPEDQGGIGYGSDKSRSDLSNTQYALDALKAAGIAEDDPVYQETLKFISRCQNNSETNDQDWAGNDGGFIYRPGNTKVEDGETTNAVGQKRYKSYGSMSYAGIKSLIHCGLKKDDPRIQQAMQWVKKNYTVEDNPLVGQQGLYYYLHTMSKALYLLGDDKLIDDNGDAHDWRTDIINKLAREQAADGSWTNTAEQRWMEGDPILATSYALMTLEFTLQK